MPKFKFDECYLFPKFDSQIKVVYNKCSKKEKIAMKKLQKEIEKSCKIK